MTVAKPRDFLKGSRRADDLDNIIENASPERQLEAAKSKFDVAKSEGASSASHLEALNRQVSEAFNEPAPLFIFQVVEKQNMTIFLDEAMVTSRTEKYQSG